MSVTRSWAWVWGEPSISALFKQYPEDFCVDEDLGFEPTGDGEHLCLLLRKRELTTARLAERLARAAGVRSSDVGYAGLKDRQGICTQWFSIWLPGRANGFELDPALYTREQGAGRRISSPTPSNTATPDASAPDEKAPDVEVLRSARNSRKIRRGSHRANIFTIRLRKVRGPADELEERLARVSRGGVPNYFGEQRFGAGGDNVLTAERLFRGEIKLRKGFKRGMMLSAARSFLFNEVLSERIQQGNWNRYVEGDCMNLEGSGSVFTPEAWDETLQQRLDSFDIHPTGPLWGGARAEKRQAESPSAQIEREVARRHELLCQGLEQAGLKHARRSLRLLPRDFSYNRQLSHGQDREQHQESGEELLLRFALPPGTYATAVLREIVNATL